MFAKPWETQGDGVVESAKADAAQKPWEPKVTPVPPTIAEELRQERSVGGRNYIIEDVKAQAFAKAYLIDMNATNALIRIGEADQNTDASLLSRRAHAYLRNPVCLHALQAYVARIETDHIISRERILYGLLEEATYKGQGGSSSARVAAWSKLAKLMGMELPPGDDPKQNRAPGGVLLVPFAPNIEQWEQQAMGQQARLKADVRA